MGKCDGCCPGGWHLVTSNTFSINNGCHKGSTVAEVGFDGCQIKQFLLFTTADTEVLLIVVF